MFRFKVVTLFPEIFDGFRRASLLGKAQEAGLLDIELIDLRDYTHDKHRKVDDTPYGGGSGMVMKTGPIIEALEAQPGCRKVLMTPQGRPLDQATARRLSEESSVLLFCGRYEGVDERVRGMFDEEIAIGDFVLNGGEVAAMVVIETVSRLLPGVIGNMDSVVEESFTSGLLEYPQYTRPEVIAGKQVPPVLLSGNHEMVRRWRRGQSLLRTAERRPDLFERLTLTEDDELLLAEARAEARKDEDA